jgi:hypothetical protein
LIDEGAFAEDEVLGVGAPVPVVAGVDGGGAAGVTVDVGAEVAAGAEADVASDADGRGTTLGAGACAAVEVAGGGGGAGACDALAEALGRARGCAKAPRDTTINASRVRLAKASATSVGVRRALRTPLGSTARRSRVNGQ